MVALACNLNFRGPSFLTGLSAVFVARLHHAPAWQMRTLTLLICRHSGYPCSKFKFGLPESRLRKLKAFYCAGEVPMLRYSQSDNGRTIAALDRRGFSLRKPHRQGRDSSISGVPGSPRRIISTTCFRQFRAFVFRLPLQLPETGQRWLGCAHCLTAFREKKRPCRT